MSYETKETPPNLEKGVTDRVNLDTLLTEELGQFGRFQLKMLVLTALIEMFASWGANEYVFSTGRINTRCLIRECDPVEPEYSPSWILSAVPSSGNGFDNCQRYGNTSSIVANGSCSPDLFDTSLLLPCEEYVYENQNTVVYDYELACDEWRRSLIGSVRTMGTILALPITGYMSDRWGRRTAVVINAFNTAWLGLVRYWARTYVGFMISECAEALFGGGMFSSAYIMIVEVTGPKYRVAAGSTMHSFYSFGQVMLGLIASKFQVWQSLTLVLFTPMLFTFSYIWIMDESVRWCLSTGKYEQAEALLFKIAKMNRKTISPNSLESLRRTIEEENKIKVLEKQQKSEWLIALVFRHKRVLYRCMVTPLCWLATTFIYHGLSINAVNLSGNKYWNYMAVAAIEIPGYWTSIFLLNKIGRKPVIIAGYFVCFICQITFVFMPSGNYGLSLGVYLVGKFSIALVLTSIYMYTAELYPTKYRHNLFSFSSMVGRVGSSLAPLTPAVGAATFEEMPFVLFGGLALVAGLLVFTTPETLGTKMPDTMEDAENIGKNK